MADEGVWVIRVKGKGTPPYNRRFGSKAEAMAEAQALRAKGFRVLVVKA